MPSEKRRSNVIENSNAANDKKQRFSASLLFKPNIDSSKSKADGQSSSATSSDNDDDLELHPIPKLSIKRTLNRDSNLSEFRIENKKNENESEVSVDENLEDENEADAEESEDFSNQDDVDVGEEDSEIDGYDEDDERENDTGLNNESQSDDENHSSDKDVNNEPENDTSHNIESIQSKQNILKLKLKQLAETTILKTNKETSSAPSPRRGRPPKIKDSTDKYLNETSDDQSNIKIKGKRGRKPGYRKYPEGYLNPKCSMSKTPRSITSYFLFCQVNRPLIAEKNPDLKLRAIQRILSEQWNKLTDKERLVWRQKAVKLSKKGSKGMISTGIGVQTQNKSISKKINYDNLSDLKSEGKAVEILPVNEKAIKTLPFPASLANFEEDCKPVDLAAYLSILGESMTQFGNNILKLHEVFLLKIT